LFDALKRSIAWPVLDYILPHRFYMSAEGRCPCCDSATRFVAYNPWLRDHFRCATCGSIPRQRALIRVISETFPDWTKLDIHESSPSEEGASRVLRDRCRGYSASQFFPNQPPGTVVSGHRNENLEKLTFADATFDLVVTQDVLEHAFDPDRVFSEIARVLKPGGAHIFTVPLLNKHQSSEVWAVRAEDGSPRFLHEPEHHGNPVDPRGAPVTMHCGFDIVERIRRACNLSTEIVHLDDLAAGIRAEYIEVLVTRKPRD
jgi:SAM-dependent methyltransferase